MVAELHRLPERVVPATAEEASPEDVAALAKHWSDGVINCRVKGHDGEQIRAVWNPVYRYWSITERCSRCQRTEEYEETEDGERISKPRTKYQEGYLTPRGTGRITGRARGALRVARRERNRGLEIVRLKGSIATGTIPKAKSAREALGIAEPPKPGRSSSG